MELDNFNLEDIWQKGKHHTQNTSHSQADIDQMLQKSTNSTLGKINKSIFFEAGLMIVMSVLLGILIQNFILPFGIGIISLIYYYFKYRVLNYTPNTNIKDTLQRLITVFQRYLLSYYLGLWGCMGFLGSTFFINFRRHLQKYTEQNFYAQIALDVVLTSVVVGVFYFVGRYYIRLLYGNYLQELKKYKKELDNME